MAKTKFRVTHVVDVGDIPVKTVAALAEDGMNGDGSFYLFDFADPKTIDYQVVVVEKTLLT